MSRRFRVTRLLGEGAFGAVYLADCVSRGLTRTVALKLLHKDMAAQEGVVQRLRDEARMLALIHHRAIVRVDDLVELGGNWTIVMEYVAGADLAQLLERGPIPPRAAFSIAEEVANALHTAATQVGADGRPLRLVHRDIKPSNIRVTAAGEVKLLDFGVARAEFAGREAGTTGTAFGTIPYMAPERFEGVDTHAGDIYALGVLLFEMVTGALPGPNATSRDRRPPGDEARELWTWLGRVHPALLQLVSAMLEDDPGRRPGARDCARALGELRGQVGGDLLEDWAAREVPLVGESTAWRRGALTGTLLVEADGARPAKSGRPWAAALLVVGVAGLGVLALAGAGALLAARAHLSTPTEPTPVAVTPAPAPATVATPAVVAPAPTTTAATKATRAASPRPATTSSSTASSSPASSSPAGSASAGPSSPTTAAPRSKSPTGTVVVVGDGVAIALDGAAGRYGSGEVPAGAYSATATFPGGGTIQVPTGVTVPAGGRVTVRCNAKFVSCTVE